MKWTAYETIFGSPTAAGLTAPFLPNAVVSTLQTELLQTVIKIRVENDGNIRDICRKWGYGIWGGKLDKENNERIQEVQEKAKSSDEETEGF